MPRIYVIAGHGAGDTGACGHGYQEAERVRALASRMGKLGGTEVIVLDMSRNWFADRGILGLDLPPGSQIVELHMDSGPRGAKGGHVIVKPGKQPDGYDLALAALLSGMFPGRSEPIRGQSLANATRSAQKGYGYRLLECGFITDELDVGTFNSHIDQLALGIMDAFGIVPGAPTKEDELIRIDIPNGTYPVYRAYNAAIDDHFYTSSEAEYGNLTEGYAQEGVAFHGADKGEVVYRLCNPNSGQHHYTVDYDEAKRRVDEGWHAETVTFASARNVMPVRPVYRVYNPNTGAHHFTADIAERDHLVEVGWNDEGIGWYAVG